MTQTYSMPQPAEIRPKIMWVWIGIGLMIIAAISFGALAASAVAGLQSRVEDLIVIEPGATESVELRAGGYRVYTPNPGNADSSLQVTGPSGSVPLTFTSVTETYEVGSSTGRSNSQFEVTSSGTYQLTNPSPGELRVGPSVLSGVLQKLGMGFLIGAILGISGLVMMIVTLVRRSRAKNQLRQVSYQQPAAYYPIQSSPTAYPPQYQTPTPPPAPGQATAPQPPQYPQQPQQ